MDSAECSHELIFAGMCAYCGSTVLEQSDPNDESSFVSISHDTSALRATRKHAEKLHREETQRLLSERRLSLIVDLDQTIVHAWDDPAIESWLVDEAHPYHAASKDIHRIVLHDTSSRPGTMAFLEKAASVFELHIYTAGSRSYADAVAQLLDPKGRLFARRILSRDESGSQRTKDLKRLFPCDDAMVLIIDDRADTTAGPVISGVRPVPEDNDAELDVIWEHLSKIHTAFYMMQDENKDENDPLLVKADVKAVVNGFRSRTLLGCTILFSGLIAVNESFEVNEFWLMAKECGANCVKQLTPWVTHLVAAKPGTSKVHEAEDQGDVFIVAKEWLEESFYAWRRADERVHALPGVEQPSMDVEERIAQAAAAAAAMVRSRGQSEEESTVLKRTRSAIDDEDLTDDLLLSVHELKRARKEGTPLNEEEEAELLRLSPSSSAAEMQEKLRHCDWNSMMDDVMAELEEEGEQLDTETEAEAWPGDGTSSEDEASEAGTPVKHDTAASLTAYQRLEAR
ncbi:HAD-like domain-containing protein [Syncephalis pseudoplumigaleata]|uniref:RNA polymerase II subunit A C-terminal domain phosphatase n=1 Tax=Syncephalis pseudoplumigaleata TaxID=1712513 RepID=A0A4P9Z4D3_9FUNG|nr:HAD-like domain-containing protein [Syncephalis pseudoplumigaleata]|eukprot:RKP27278.1 HAD-like domain-containing protein [Syncephalis pseudoplumigaleata]